MNCYVVVEGRVVEKAVYQKWIPLVNGSLSYVEHPSLVTQDNFLIVSGNGYPNYLQVIEDALLDVRDCKDAVGNALFDRLVICVDSEDMTCADKFNEIDDFVKSTKISISDYRIVVQHFCFETWALGNRRIGARNPKNPKLVKYKKLHDVMYLDPEELPSLPEDRLNRSQFAEVYLRLMLNDKNKNISYSKSKPDAVVHEKFFSEIKSRKAQTGHIQNFQAFLDAFI